MNLNTYFSKDGNYSFSNLGHESKIFKRFSTNDIGLIDQKIFDQDYFSLVPLAEIDSVEENILITDCGHLFLKPDLKLWFDKNLNNSASYRTCPICRVTVNSIRPAEESADFFNSLVKNSFEFNQSNDGGNNTPNREVEQRQRQMLSFIFSCLTCGISFFFYSPNIY